MNMWKRLNNVKIKLLIKINTILNSFKKFLNKIFYDYLEPVIPHRIFFEEN